MEELHPFDEPEYKLKLSDLQTRWRNRPKALRDSTSKSRQDLQYRFLVYVPLDDGTREEVFDEQREQDDWSYGTAKTYWSAMTKAMEAVGVPIHFTVRVKYKVLEFLANEEDPRRPTIPITQEEIDAVTEALRQTKKPWLAIAVQLAFFLGQREGDTLKLAPNCLTVIDDTFSGMKLLAIIFRRGKTTRRRQPFTLHVPMTMRLATDLISLAAERTAAKAEYLFESGDTALPHIRTAIITVNPQLNILSIRRGGLQKMALEGASTATLLHHSRHSTKDMLDKYLNFGALSLDAARERFAP
jgi:hypothetical protein